MKLFYKFVGLFILTGAFLWCISSCSDESDATPISIWFGENIPDTINSGMQLNIKAQLLTGGDERIRRYSVIFDDGRQEVELKSEELAGATNYNIDFTVEVPYVQDEKVSCRIRIKAEGVNGFQNTINKKIFVRGGLKDNSAGFRLYASHSEGNDGFYLSDLSTTYKKSQVDSLDVYFYFDGAEEEWIPKHEGWRTDHDGIRFVRADNYDYAKATVGSLRAIYNSSVKVKDVKNIQAGNIIIIGCNGEAWGVFNCMAYDSESRLYTFSYKLIGK